MTASVPRPGVDGSVSYESELPRDYRDGVRDTWQVLLGIGQAARQSSGRELPSRSVPFTLISGFLGAGKTTLLNRLLERPSGRRIAVLVNDFGAISIDSALVRSRDASSVDLTNGCVCCSLASGLANAIADLLARPEPPEGIVLEASGVAEPLGIVHVALAHRALVLNGIVALVDAENLASQLADPLIRPTVVRQIAAADIVLLNKADLARPGGLAKAKTTIRDLSSDVRILEAVQAEIPPEVVLGLGPRSRFEAVAGPSLEAHRNPFATWTFSSDRPLEDRRLAAVAGGLPPGIIRAKGFVYAASDPSCRFVLQVVSRRWSLTRDEPWSGAPRRSELVLIGFPDEAAGETALAALRACEIGSSA